MWWQYLVCIAAGYLLGAVPYGLIVGYLFSGKDVRRYGSGKTGVTNVLRVAGPIPAAIVLVADVAKGAAAAVIGTWAFDDAGAGAAGAAAAVVGHVFPIFAGFRGGRGVATAFGGILGLAPLVSLIFPVIGAILIIPTRIVSFMSVVGTPIAVLIVVAAAAAGWVSWPAAYYALFALMVIELMHIPNIRRLLAGTEPRIGEGGDRPATG
ncbi:MAG: glycerol-3-phosphate 1-O-acyltransferase PlsY [Chloroflexota bacterium]|nr:glycerol-3-phosphate 1-O-acyltransferase PlsY [Dehalococcoidia bacterium]MDW8047102.1 glycerol-3-phosphate 1-O-acyltransferase PlsY [Chloroflexota bacterium]